MLTLAERKAQLTRAHWFFKIGVPVLAAIYFVLLANVGGLDLVHVVAAIIFVFFSYWSDDTRRLARVVFPFLLYVLVYDSMRWYADYIRSPVIHIREPYDFDKRFFGIRDANGLLTPNEWWQKRTFAPLDFLCGLAYTPFFFVGESAILALYLYFTGNEKRAVRFVWVFFCANLVGFSFYYTYPAAPPWYVAAHGFTADLSVHASAAGALRFDKLVGMPIMENFYGKSADVFGAIPSLHVVYPFLSLCYSWKPMPRFRPVAVFYWLLVIFAAVYLNHHYTLDIFVGTGVALTVMAVFRLVLGPVEARVIRPAPQSAPQSAPMA